MAEKKYQLKLRRDTLANWTETNPILGDGEVGFVKEGSTMTNPLLLKVGNGQTTWLGLPQYRVFDNSTDFVLAPDNTGSVGQVLAKTANGTQWINTGSVDGAVKYTEQTLTTEQKTQARTNIGAGTYTKPDTGIPDSDLASAVQTSLSKADTAIQSHQSLAAYRTAVDQDTIDNSKMGIPSNTGSVGQVLTKSATGTEWATVSGSAASDSFFIHVPILYESGSLVVDEEHADKSFSEIVAAHEAGKNCIVMFTIEALSFSGQAPLIFSIPGIRYLFGVETATNENASNLGGVRSIQLDITSTRWLIKVWTIIPYNNYSGALTNHILKVDASGSMTDSGMVAPSNTGSVGQFLQKTVSGSQWVDDNVFVVGFSLEEIEGEDVITANKSISEIVAAASEGKECIARAGESSSIPLALSFSYEGTIVAIFSTTTHLDGVVSTTLFGINHGGEDVWDMLSDCVVTLPEDYTGNNLVKFGLDSDIVDSGISVDDITVVPDSPIVSYIGNTDETALTGGKHITTSDLFLSWVECDGPRPEGEEDWNVDEVHFYFDHLTSGSTYTRLSNINGFRHTLSIHTGSNYEQFYINADQMYESLDENGEYEYNFEQDPIYIYDNLSMTTSNIIGVVYHANHPEVEMYSGWTENGKTKNYGDVIRYINGQRCQFIPYNGISKTKTIIGRPDQTASTTPILCFGVPVNINPDGTNGYYVYTPTRASGSQTAPVAASIMHGPDYAVFIGA